ncbi:hypothetical protein BT93_L2147 [Corymbia citriodora subsp. variegata]|uniref:Serine hydroxymethyltransferase-like domain-containing protein n=1 Tax=Corymbia citriodora subsp. variegata TaxID=360336 RepID=A0A8T0CKI0_CORYI|nr:hypothetical protein BT93_L2147 [Corymbia citriodora subsp. variegata]
MDPVTMPGTSLPQAVDPEIHDLMKKFCGIELSPSEIFTPFTVDEALGYALTNKYSKGTPSNRCCYGGDQFIDALEDIFHTRALQAFRLDPACWGVIIPYSDSAAKVAAYTTFLRPHSRIMGLNLPSGMHHTHGYDTSGIRKIYFESTPFVVDPSTGYIDYNKLEEKALNFCPHLTSSSAAACGALLLCDMADVSGLIAAQEAANPFEHCEIVTTTPYKSSTGPTAGMIFYRKGQPEYAIYNFEDKTLIFPSLLSGPHNNQVRVLAVALQQARSLEFKAYAKQVKANAVALGNYLLSKGYKLLTGGTDNHLILWDLRPLGLTGTHAMTCMDFVEKDFEQIGEFLHRAVTIVSTIQKQHGKLMKDFDKGLDNNEDIEALKVHVQNFSLLHRHAQFLSRP